VLSPFVLKPAAGSFTDWPDGPHVPSADLPAYRAQVILTDGGVYDNHGIEPIEKSCLTNFVSDGGAPFQRTGTLHTDWISQLKRILDVTDNQVRALRRRELIERFTEGKVIGDESKLAPDGEARMGAYWGIDTDPRKVEPAGAIACNPDVTHKLAQLGTRLSDLGDLASRQMINWGYAVCDRSVRANYAGPVNSVPPRLPYPTAPLT
jgi:NTE family protein